MILRGTSHELSFHRAQAHRRASSDASKSTDKPAVKIMPALPPLQPTFRKKRSSEADLMAREGEGAGELSASAVERSGRGLLQEGQEWRR